MLLLALAACLVAVTVGKETVDLKVATGELKRVEGTNSYELGVKDDDMLQMYQKWMDTGMSSLMSAVANKKLKRHRKSTADKFGECSSKADDVIKHAKCLKKLFNHKFETRKPKKINRFDRYRQHRNGEEIEEKSSFRQQWDDNVVRRKRSVKSASGYKIKKNKVIMTPMMQIAKSIYESIKHSTNKTDLPKWQDTIENIKNNGLALKKKKKELEDKSDESLDAMGLQGVKHQLDKDAIDFDGDLEDIQKDPVKFKKLMAEIKKKKGNTPESKIMDLVRSGMEMGYKMAGKDTSKFYNSSMKIASPKFFELFPEKDNDTINLISPSLFALHDSDDPVENLTSIPNMMRAFGLEEHQVFLDIIMEVAGVNEKSEDIEKQLKETSKNQTERMYDAMKNMVDENNVPLYPTEQNATAMGHSPEKFEFWQKLRDSYTKDQLREMNHTGYAVLNKQQITALYGPQSHLYNETKYNLLMSMTEEEVHEEMEKQIEMMAEMESFKLRKKDIVLAPTLFTWVVLNAPLASQPFILSPLLFDPIILSPSIWGAVILTPWVFVPFVLSPRLLGCIILSPWLFSPIILTPIALHPAILSPGLFNPLILSPTVMVPFILSPQVFTPIILSPLCMDPLILNPLVGSPLILSPFVLTPIILSPQFLGGLIMSPYALSPVILSPLAAFVALLSPSWLS
ncbi:unnamed protein product [Bursaphelenchus xylophilus]|uniref:(pine wood nematode) hypothetical protein n=1 Tax=Bursaphelenchus xylophilus TaxID=6326 RepID=A0A1I7SC80_BURXY|nr:unnamed protein product [Bursaphelenchus xylophilus]CAG9094591.1 unnamed protein product [Bursaphelenchus xylophilus]